MKSINLTVLALTLSFSTASWAADTSPRAREQARTLGYAGVEAFGAGNFATAADKLERAYAVLQVPSLGLWSARALARMGKLTEASQRLRETVALSLGAGDPRIQREAQEQARVELSQLEARIPRLRVQMQACDSERRQFFIDRVAVPPAKNDQSIPVNPGQHEVIGRCGELHAATEVDVQESQSTVVHLVPQAVAPSAAEERAAQDEAEQPDSTGPSLSTWGWVAWAAGGLSFGTAAVTGVLASDRLEEIRANPECSRNACGPDAHELVESYSTLRTVSAATWIAGGVLVATGVTLVLVGEAEQERVALHAGPQSIALSGKF